MIRVGTGPGGHLGTTAEGKVPGRGAYVCVNAECVNRARKRGSLSRVLRVGVPDEFFDELMVQVEARKKEQVGQHQSS